MSDRFSPPIFIHSLPQGTAQQKNPLSLMQSKMITASINVFLDIFENTIIPEKDVDAPLWNPEISLEKWMSIFRIELAILNNDYSDPDFLNYIIRFYNRLLVHRPIPISLKALNILFDQYSDLGMSIRFDDVFTLGDSVLEGEQNLGLPGSSAIISIDESKKYALYSPVVVRLLLRILPINASLRIEQPFSFPGEIPGEIPEETPPYNKFVVVHNCNAPYQATDTKLIYAQGDFVINQSSILALELNNILVKKEICFDLIPFRPLQKINSFYLSFFILNSNAQVITINLVLEDPDTSAQEILTYTINNIALDRWTSVLIAIPDLAKSKQIKSLNLFSDKNINDTYNQFYIDQVRMYTGDNNTSYDLFIETEINNKELFSSNGDIL